MEKGVGPKGGWAPKVDVFFFFFFFVRLFVFFLILMLEENLQSPLDFGDIKPVNYKWYQPWILLEGLLLKLKLQYFGHLMGRADSLEKSLVLGKNESKQRRGQQRMRCLESTNDSMDISLSKLWEILEDRGAWQSEVCEVSESWTWLCDRITTTNLGCINIYNSLYPLLGSIPQGLRSVFLCFL